LAVALEEVFRTKDCGLDFAAFKACLRENSVTPPNGAIGRFRMCAGLMLRRVAKKNGFVVIGGKKIGAPAAKKRRRKAKATGAEK